jgi:hypothetical protein
LRNGLGVLSALPTVYGSEGTFRFVAVASDAAAISKGVLRRHGVADDEEG